MTSTNTTEQIFKTDVVGRVRTPAPRREQLLDEFERSGLSGTEFARLVGVKYQTFATWAQTRRRKRGEYPKAVASRKIPSIRWIEAVAEPGAPKGNAASALVIELPGGAAMRVGDPAQAQLAARILKLLQKDPGAC